MNILTVIGGEEELPAVLAEETLHVVGGGVVVEGFGGMGTSWRSGGPYRKTRCLAAKNCTHRFAFGLTTVFMISCISSMVLSILERMAWISVLPYCAVRGSSVSQSFKRPPSRPRSPLMRANSATRLLSRML